jgi:hypothetical protein
MANIYSSIIVFIVFSFKGTRDLNEGIALRVDDFMIAAACLLMLATRNFSFTIRQTRVPHAVVSPNYFHLLADFCWSVEHNNAPRPDIAKDVAFLASAS